MASKYEKLFTPLKVGSITLKNRYAVAPMGGRFACFGLKGEYSENGIEYFVDRAKGGFGLIVTGANFVDHTVDPFDPRNDTIGPDYSPVVFGHGARTLTRRVHAYGTKIFLQLSVGQGRMGNGKSVSPIPYYNNPDQLCEEMTVEEIERKIAAVVKYAQLAKQWGFDGVEIHGHHWGYLLDQFAMAYTNHRTDEYGGDLDGRLTFARKIITGIKEVCGQDYPVSMRLCMKTYMKGYNQPSLNGDGEVGRDIDEAIEIAKRYEQYGVDMINCNTGSYDAFFYCVSPYYLDKGYNVEYASRLKAALNIPVIVAGAMDDPDICERAVASGAIDGVTIGRAGLVDSDYPNKVAAEKLEDIRPCIKCTNCIETVLSSGCPLCSANPAAMLEQRYGVKETLEKKKIVVIGGGVSGMEAAITAKKAGHDVELYEATDVLGGHLIEAGSHPFKQGIADLNKWYQHELTRMGIPVHLNTKMTAQDVRATGCDTAILAVGSYHFVPPIPGHAHEKAVVCYDVLMKKKKVGQNVVVVGGGLTGCELAYDLARFEGKNVTLVEGLSDILSAGPKVPNSVNMMLRLLLKEYRVNIVTDHMIAEVNDEGAVVKAKDGTLETIPADNVVFAIGLRPQPSMAAELLGGGVTVYEVGDGSQVGNIQTCTAAAYEVARAL